MLHVLLTLTEKAPSADSAAAFSSLEIKMNNFTVRNKVKPLKLYCFKKNVGHLPYFQLSMSFSLLGGVTFINTCMYM